MSNFDLESVIEDSINDVVLDQGPEVETEPDSSTEEVQTDSGTDEVVETTDESTDETNSSQVPAPGSETEEAPQGGDEFSKRFGIASKSVTGRENRIPYSRVKKIIEKNDKDLKEKYEKEYQPKIQEYESKLTVAQERADKYTEFETLVDGNPKEFLGILAQHPKYKGFFDYLNENLPAGQPKAGDTSGVAPKGEAPPGQSMPKPNRKLSDGSLVYDEEGLQALMDWQSQQTEAKVLASVSKQYGPIRQQWEIQQQREKIMPQIDAQIVDARKWPNFEELEDEIVGLLEADQKLSLEGAYRVAYQKNVVPKLQAPPVNKDSIRAEVIAEMKRKGNSTAVSGTATTPKKSAGAPRSLLDVIAGEVEKLR